MLAGLELTPTAPFAEEEKTRVGRRARPPMLLQLVRGVSELERAGHSRIPEMQEHPKTGGSMLSVRAAG